MNNSAPLVSVIIPVYNVEPYLRQCLDSVINQTYRNLEILIIDDGSTGECGRICDIYKKDDRVRVFHTENRGLSAARNQGIEKSHGKYIYFIDSDDWIDADLIEKAVAGIGSADILCFSKYEGEYTGYEALTNHLNGKIGNVIWDKLYTQECFNKLRFPEGRMHEDTATTYKLLHQAQTVKCLDVYGYHYRKREGSISHTHGRQNLIDYWIATKERYEYCKCLVDAYTYNRLLESCAFAIARAWAWRIDDYKDDSPEWEKMSSFSKKLFTYDIRKNYPLRVHGGVLLARYNSRLSFWLAHIIHMMTNHISKTQ